MPWVHLGDDQGTSGSIRNADELSTTIAPAQQPAGDALCVVAPAENSAMSRPVKSAVAASSTVICSSPHGKVVRRCALMRNTARGPAGSYAVPAARMTPPTCPVAPKTPTSMRTRYRPPNSAVVLGGEVHTSGALASDPWLHKTAGPRGRRGPAAILSDLATAHSTCSASAGAACDSPTTHHDRSPFSSVPVRARRPLRRPAGRSHQVSGLMKPSSMRESAGAGDRVAQRHRQWCSISSRAAALSSECRPTRPNRRSARPHRCLPRQQRHPRAHLLRRPLHRRSPDRSGLEGGAELDAVVIGEGVQVRDGGSPSASLYTTIASMTFTVSDSAGGRVRQRSRLRSRAG